MSGTSTSPTSDSVSDSVSKSTGTTESTATTGAELALECTAIPTTVTVADVAAYEDGSVVVGQVVSDAWIGRFDSSDAPMWSDIHDGPADEELLGDHTRAVVVTNDGTIITTGDDAMGIYEYLDWDVFVPRDATRWSVAAFDAKGDQLWRVTDPDYVPFDPDLMPMRVSSARDAVADDRGGIISLVPTGRSAR